MCRSEESFGSQVPEVELRLLYQRSHLTRGRHSGRAARYTEHAQKTLDSVFTFLLFSLLGKQSLAVVAKGGLKPNPPVLGLQVCVTTPSF